MMMMFALSPSLYSIHLIGHLSVMHSILYGDLLLVSSGHHMSVMNDGDRIILPHFLAKLMQVSFIVISGVLRFIMALI
jgi:hypothetical protein